MHIQLPADAVFCVGRKKYGWMLGGIVIHFIAIYLIGAALSTLGLLVLNLSGGISTIGGMLLCFTGNLLILHRFLIDLWKDWKAKRFSWKNPNVRWLAVLGFLEVLSIPSYFRDDGVKMQIPSRRS